MATPVQTLGGKTNSALALNNAGTVAGNSAEFGDTVTHAFSYSGGVVTDLGTLGISNSFANGINSAGTVVGNYDYSTPTPSNILPHAYIYSKGLMSDIGTLGGTVSYALAVNDTGVVVGFSNVTGDAASHAFVYGGSAMVDLGTLGGTNSKAYAINAAGTVVGNADVSVSSTNHHAFSYSGGTMADLGTLGGAKSTALGINAAGTIVGDAQTAGGAIHAFVYSGGKMTDLGSLNATDLDSYAYSINSSGVIVGYSILSDSTTRGWIYANGAMTDLNTLVSLPGVTIVNAQSINDFGQIAANGSDGRGYLLTPAGLHFVVTAPVSANLGYPVSVTVTALDGSNNVATLYGGSVVLSSTDGAAKLPAPSALAGGTATFAVTFKTPGSQTVSATDPEIAGSAGTSGAISVAAVSAPAITIQPVSQTVNTGADAAFWIAASGTPPLAYQWYFNGTAIAGATQPLLQAVSATAYSAGAYTVSVTNVAGTVTSAPATLGVSTYAAGNPVSFASQPQSQTLSPGDTVVFSAQTATAAGATAPFVAYQWFLNGAPIAGATGPTYSVAATSATSGAYYCIATDSSGSLVSDTATLAVATGSNPSRIVDVSCRGHVGTGSGQLIVGFVLGGSGTSGLEPVLVRASGPALATLGVTGALADPLLALDTTAGELVENGAWAGNAQIAAAAAAVGAFPWTNNASLDAAILTSLAPGAYTAVISGASGDQGVALAEAYDAPASGTASATAPRLVNISSRAQVGTGANVLIAGFVIEGTTSKTVLVRAAGPALAAYGVAGVLTDPELQLFKGNNDGTSSLQASNTGWGGNAQIAAAAAGVGAYSWGSGGSADSALLVTLPPGAYTAQVSGASGDTGVALVEVYEVP